jgi:hypothetical protein
MNSCPKCKTLMFGLFQVPRCPRCELAPEVPTQLEDPALLWVTCEATESAGPTACAFKEERFAKTWFNFLGSGWRLVRARPFDGGPPLKWERVLDEHPLLPGVSYAKAVAYETAAAAKAVHSNEYPKLIIVKTVETSSK